jgi:hypothetical protein
MQVDKFIFLRTSLLPAKLNQQNSSGKQPRNNVFFQSTASCHHPGSWLLVDFLVE